MAVQHRHEGELEAEPQSLHHDPEEEVRLELHLVDQRVADQRQIDAGIAPDGFPGLFHPPTAVYLRSPRAHITRAVLEVCLEARQPVTITTKSDRVLRDLDLLEAMARLNLIAVGLSVTNLDPRLSGLLEPRAAAPAKRLAALAKQTAFLSTDE